MPKLLNGIKGDSNPGSLDCESGILPTELPRSTTPFSDQRDNNARTIHLLRGIACGEFPVFRKKQNKGQTKDNRTWVADQEPVKLKRLEP